MEPGDDAAGALQQFLRQHAGGDLVIKPAIGAGSRDASPPQADRAPMLAHITRLLGQGRSVLLQRTWIGSMVGRGGADHFEGRYSHAIRKGPLLRRGSARRGRYLRPRSSHRAPRGPMSRPWRGGRWRRCPSRCRSSPRRSDRAADGAVRAGSGSPSLLFFTHAPAPRHLPGRQAPRAQAGGRSAGKAARAVCDLFRRPVYRDRHVTFLDVQIPTEWLRRTLGRCRRPAQHLRNAGARCRCCAWCCVRPWLKNLAQEVFLEVLRNLGAYSGAGSLQPGCAALPWQGAVQLAVAAPVVVPTRSCPDRAAPRRTRGGSDLARVECAARPDSQHRVAARRRRLHPCRNWPPL